MPAKADSVIRRTVEIANQHPRLRLDRRKIVRAIHLLDENFVARGEKRPESATRRCPPGALSLVFLTDSALARLHGDFLNDPTSTDVITFEGDALLGVAGEICVSADTAAAYAKKQGHDFSDELTLYLVHGWLHLAGYDDLQPAKKQVMRRAEKRAMQILRDHDCSPPFKLLSL